MLFAKYKNTTQKYFKVLITIFILFSCQKSPHINILEEQGILVSKNTSKAEYSLILLNYLRNSSAKISEKVVSSLVHLGANVDYTDQFDNSALHIACTTNANEKVLEILVKAGGSINAKNKFGDTPLHKAIENRREAIIIKTLVNLGADIEIKNDKQKNPVMYAFFHSIENLHLLLPKKYNVSKTDIDFLIKVNSISKTKEAIVVDALKNLKEPFNIIKLLTYIGFNINTKDNKGNNFLHIACENIDNFRAVKLLIDNGCNAEEKNKNGNTPLHIAIQHNKSEVFVKKLIDYYLDLNVKNKYKLQPIHYAIKYGKNAKTIELLANTGVDINANNIYEKVSLRPLFFTIRHTNNIEIIKKILALTTNLNPKNQDNALHIASKYGKGKLIPLLVEAGVNINGKDKEGNTPLNTVIFYKDEHKINSISTLIKLGADVNEENKNSETPLIKTLHTNDINEIKKIIHLLIESGADVNKTDSIKVSPLSILIKLHYNKKKFVKEMLNFLVKNGANPNQQDKDKMAALHYAVKYGNDNLNYISDLVALGANVNIKNDKGLNPLQFMVTQKNGNMKINMFKNLIKEGIELEDKTSEGLTLLQATIKKQPSFELAKAMIDLGANVHTTDNKQNNLLHYAAKYNSHFIPKLINYDINVNDKNSSNVTPLQLAVQHGTINSIQTLLKAEANINEVNSNSDTALSIAVKYRDINFVKLLVKNGADTEQAILTAKSLGKKKISNFLQRVNE